MLYLRGLPRPFEVPARGWPQVLAQLRRAEGLREAVERLSSAGLSAESLLLQEPSLADLSARLVRLQRVLTAVSPGYPERWRLVLGPAAPPALWRAGPAPPGPFVGIVGSRQVPPRVAAFASEVGSEAVRLGLSVISGGAEGSDRAGVLGARRQANEQAQSEPPGGTVALEVLPRGLSRSHPPPRGVCRVSVAEPKAEFSASLAMERNALLYAASEVTVIAHARLRQGGTWGGATDALRRRLGMLAIRALPEEEDLATRALIALGAQPIAHASELARVLEADPIQLGLFGEPLRLRYPLRT